MLHKNLIDGAWAEGASVSKDVNPSNLDDVVGEFAYADRQQTLDAIAAAKAAFTSWSVSPIQQRFDILDKAATEILARKDELGQLLSREEGKTLPEGIGEAARAGQIFKFFAGECLRLTGQKVPSTRPGIDVEMTREPMGVVGLITPWNFPIAIPAWKIAPALASGNSVVIKPADLVPGCAWALVDILDRAGSGRSPQSRHGPGLGRGRGYSQLAGRERGELHGLGRHGGRIAARAPPSRQKFQLEMGGKNPLVVLDDADLKTAVASP